MRKIILFFITVMALNATTPTYENVTTLYVATFDRAPDVGGLLYWVNSGMELEDIAKSFMVQDESKRKYYPNNEIYVPDFVDTIYLNVFDHLPDSGGKEYWVGYIMAGGFDNIYKFMLAVINGAQGSDAALLAEKTKYALDGIRDQLPTVQIVWCHDFTLSEVYKHFTMKTLQKNETTPAELREELRKLDFKRFPFSVGTDWEELGLHLNKHDVIIIGEAHSGIVCDDRGTICHLLQDGKGARPNSLSEIMNRCNPIPDSPTGHSVCPYKNTPIEVWRRDH